MIVVGVTGGIGCGKSTVAAMLAARGAVVIDADEIAREVAAPAGAAYRALVDHFGPGVVGPGGALDRAAIAARVFSDPEELAALNAITHPAIAAAMLARLGRLVEVARTSEAAAPPVVLEIPLLTEASRARYGLAGVVVVDAPVEVAVKRLVEQRGLREADAESRVRAQPSREARRRLADVVVDNAGSRADLEAPVQHVWSWLSQLQRAASVDRASQETTDPDGAEDHKEEQ